MRLAQAKTEGPLPLAKIEPDLAVVKQILGYFVQNSKAADTLEGIARWRLFQEEIRQNVQQTERALEWLVEQELVEELRLPGHQTPIFRLNLAHQEDAVRFLAKHRKKAGKEK
jgi:hypothetical protein